MLWMEQIARNLTMGGWGILCGRRYLLHDRDTKYSAASRAMIESAHIVTLPLPARSPNLNAHAERWVRSVMAECLSKIVPFGERPLGPAMNDDLAHYHTERNRQGKNNVLLFRQMTETRRDKPMRCHDRLGGLLRYYHRAAT
jgi:putative transposase